LVYVADLLVVMTDWLKIVRVHARNVPRVHGHKRLDDNASLTSLTGPGKWRFACSMRRGTILLKHKQELSYRKQIARQLRRQYVEGIYRSNYRWPWNL